MSIHSQHECDVIYFFLLIHFLNPETLLSFTFQLLPVTLSTDSNMDRPGDRGGLGTSRNGSGGASGNLIGVLQSMVECQQQQLKICTQVLTIAHEVEEHNWSGKRTFQQIDRKYPVMDREGPVRLNDALKAKCLFQYLLQ